MRAPAIFLITLALAATARAEVLVIRNARVIAAPDKVLPRATIVIDKGKITAVGPKVKEPPLARVLDAEGLTVAPGFVCAATGLGLATGRVTRASTEVRVRRVDDVDPWDGIWEAARRAGVTTIGLAPMAMGVGGHGAVIKPRPTDRAGMTVRDDAPLVLGFVADTGTAKAFRGGFGAAKKWIAAAEVHAKAAAERAKVEAEAKKAAAEHAKVAAEAKKAGKEVPPAPAAPKLPEVPKKPAEDPKVMPFVRALRGEIPCVVRLGGTEGPLAHLLPLLTELGLKPIVLLDGSTAARSAKRLAEAGITVGIPGSISTDRRTGAYENAPRLLHEAKVSFVLLPSGTGGGAFGEIRHRLARLVRAGLPRAAALAGVTTTPAKVLGLEKRVGSIRPGADADLILLDGDVLDPLARVVRVMIAGETVHERNGRYGARHESAGFAGKDSR